MLTVSAQPVDARALEAAVSWPGAGAVLTFAGVARRDEGSNGAVVQALEYDAYVEMAVAEMRRIRDEIAARWPEARLAAAHRTGRVPVGQTSIVVAVSAPHRAEAYEASRFAIDQLKARLPVWKKEIFDAGAAWRPNTPGAGPT